MRTTTNKTHGLHGTPIYYVWAQIKQRCNNPDCPVYSRYGGRGITVCTEWYQFSQFYYWAINNGYKEGLSIDRIDNNGSYTPDNCRWVSQKVQNNNHRRNRVISYRGETKTLSGWCEALDITHGRAYNRLYALGWSVEKTFETPVSKINAKKSQYRKKEKADSVNRINYLQ